MQRLAPGVLGLGAEGFRVQGALNALSPTVKAGNHGKCLALRTAVAAIT